MAAPSARARLLPVLVALALGAGCSDGASREETSGPSSPPDRTLTTVADGLCRVAAEATTDTQQARVTFFAEVHVGLHTLAARLLDVDRKAAADLLRAKERAETAFAAALEAAAELDAALADLHAAARAGLALLDVTVGACPPT